jgi:hypothetical protein
MRFGSRSRCDRLRLVPEIDSGNPVERENTREVHLFPGPEEHVLIGENLQAT